MDGVPEVDPTKTETSGGARGGSDEDPRNWALPDTHPETSDRRRKWRPGGARPKDPYAYQKLPDEDIPMSKLPKEKSGLPPPMGGEGTEETSFGGLDYSSSRIVLANQKLENDYPKYKDNIERLNLEYIVNKKRERKNFC